MAVFKRDMVDINLETGNIHRSFLNHAIGMKDQLADHFGIRVFRNGEPVNLTGVSVQGVFMPPQGGDPIAITSGNIVSGNEAEVVLPQACYNYDGPFTLAIKLVDSTNSVTGTIRIVDGMVDNTHASGTVAPTSAVPSYQEVLAAYEQAIAVIGYSVRFDQSQSLTDAQKGTARTNIGAASKDENEKIWSDVKNHNVFLAPVINTEDATYQNISYHYTGENTYSVAGKNTATSFYNAYVGTLAELGLKAGDTIYCHIDSTDRTNVYGTLFKMVGQTSSTVFGIASGYRSYTIPSDCTGLIFRIQVPGNNVQINASIKIEITKEPEDRWLNFGLNPGKELANNTDLDTISENGIWLLDSTYTYSHIPPSLSGIACFLFSFISAWQAFQIIAYYPSSYTKIYMRVKNLSLGTAWSSWHVAADGFYGIMADKYALLYNPDESNYGQTSIDLNTLVQKNKFYLVPDDITVTNKPTGWGGVGFIQCIYSGQWNLQIIYPFSGGRIYKRRGNSGGTVWEDWQEVNGGGNTYNITNEYEFPEYSQSVTVNASPTITTDTNNYLASTGDNTDRTADILAMLSTTGICRLGPGLFVVSNLQMPDGSAIIGSGYSTIIHLAGTSDGYAIKIGSRCTVQDVRIRGSETDLTFGETIGGRHGILWQGDYTEHSTAPNRSMISNVWIYNFTGGGITCYDTGYGTSNALEVVNVYAFGCWAGVNISYWSEFHKFTNVRCGQCRIGCVNNGGNNVFVNCDFSSNLEIAMLMDNSQGQSPNNTHGSCIGCVFNHTAHNGVANSGVGIKILNCASGFMFTGCQIYFSQIYLEDTSGIVIADTNFGNTNCNVTIDGGGTVVFANCMTEGAIPISITDNQKVHFANCYNKSTGASWGT